MIKAKSSVKEDSSVLDKIFKRLVRLDGSEVDYGYYSTQYHPEADWDMASLALTMERGSTKHNIPARPFMFQSNINLYLSKKTMMIAAYNDYILGKGSLMELLGRVGVAAKLNVSETIKFQRFVALKPATIAAKGFDTILIESGLLANSIIVTPKPK